MKQQIPIIRAECTQMGLHVEATLNGTDWQTVQLTSYKVRASPTVMQYSTCIDPARDRAEYFETLRARGVEFTVWNGDIPRGAVLERGEEETELERERRTR